MSRSLLHLGRIALGVILFLVGVIGLFLPVIQGGLLILIAIPLVSPEHGKRLIDKVKELRAKFKK